MEAQFRRLQEELEGRGLCSALAGLQCCADLGAIPLPKLHSLQSRLRLDLEAVDGVSPGSGSGRRPPAPPPSPGLQGFAFLSRTHLSPPAGSVL